MPAASIRVTPEQLQQVSAQLNGGAANIDSLLGQLRTNVAPLGSDWAGAAQAQFQAHWERWERGARDVHTALTGISQLMAQASSNYESTEQSIARSFG
jgi:early secretory antigenic target protein ESAT-6